MRDKISTTHSDLRLIQRAREFDKPMTEVWEQAVPCEVKYHGYDEARVSAEYDIVLLKEDSKIVTCLNNTHNVTVAGQDFDRTAPTSTVPLTTSVCRLMRQRRWKQTRTATVGSRNLLVEVT